MGSHQVICKVYAERILKKSSKSTMHSTMCANYTWVVFSFLLFSTFKWHSIDWLLFFYFLSLLSFCRFAVSPASIKNTFFLRRCQWLIPYNLDENWTIQFYTLCVHDWTLRCDYLGIMATSMVIRQLPFSVINSVRKNFSVSRWNKFKKRKKNKLAAHSTERWVLLRYVHCTRYAHLSYYSSCHSLITENNKKTFGR